jgi:hypothetical protein
MTVVPRQEYGEVFTFMNQQSLYVPFEEIRNLAYNILVPGKSSRVHIGKWKEYEIELREPVGTSASLDKEVGFFLFICFVLFFFYEQINIFVSHFFFFCLFKYYIILILTVRFTPNLFI